MPAPRLSLSCCSVPSSLGGSPGFLPNLLKMQKRFCIWSLSGFRFGMVDGLHGHKRDGVDGAHEGRRQSMSDTSSQYPCCWRKPTKSHRLLTLLDNWFMQHANTTPFPWSAADCEAPLCGASAALVLPVTGRAGHLRPETRRIREVGSRWGL